MNLNDYYILVDTKNTIVSGSLQLLPENWNNIHGLTGLSDQELSNLDWSGNDGVGWINMCSDELKNYNSSDDNLESNKLSLKRIITNERKDEILRPIIYEDITVTPDKTTYTILSCKKILAISNPDLVINFKFGDRYKTINADQIHEICAIIENKLQSSFDAEMKIYQQIETCNHLTEFKNINYNAI